MTWPHLTAFVWLRWRLIRNQWRRGGAANRVLMSIFMIGSLVMAIPLLIGCFSLGVYLIPKARPEHLLYAWDGLIAAFLFFWAVGLLAEVQRAEPLALSKFLHLPVSPAGAFLINYLSSLVRLSFITFGPPMLGFALALVVAKGVRLLPVLALLAAFLLMITALTYQFQGWLASLMNDPRRRRAVIAVLTVAFVAVMQLPNLVNFATPWGVQKRVERSNAFFVEQGKLRAAYEAKQIDAAELARREQENTDRFRRENQRANREIARLAWTANAFLPVGWLPLGVMTLAEGRLMPAALGLAGMTLIGAASLRRAYRTTVGLYQGRAANRRPRPSAGAERPARARPQGAGLLEARIPGVSEPVAAVALAGLRSLMRAPEAKMMLLTPLMMTVIFGTTLWSNRHALPLMVRPVIAIGAMGCVLMGLLQLMANQFGFDREGFRVFVLCAAPRRDILLGKNLAFLPLALGMAAVGLAAVQAFCPLRADHLLAMIPLYLAMYLLFCILANLMSIYTPIYLPSGSLKASSPKLTTVLLQVLMFMFLFPLSQTPVLLPLGIEAGLHFLDRARGVPVCLLLSLAECAVIAILYRLAIGWQGTQLEAREQKILDVVANRAP